jgi:hypothetical protein
MVVLLPPPPPPQSTTTATAVISIKSSHYPEVENRNKSKNDTKILSPCYFTYVWNPVYFL